MRNSDGTIFLRLTYNATRFGPRMEAIKKDANKFLNQFKKVIQLMVDVRQERYIKRWNHIKNLKRTKEEQ